MPANGKAPDAGLVQDALKKINAAVALRRPVSAGGARVRGYEANATTPTKLPGKAGVDYQEPAIEQYRGMYAHGIKLFRIGSVPSRTRGALLDEYMAHVAKVLAIAPDVTVVLDPMHCYGVDSTDSTTAKILGAGWSVADFAAQWATICQHPTFKANPRIVALDLLNEPNIDTMTGMSDAAIIALMPQAWQAAITAIRNTGYTGWLLCQPSHYAKAMDVNITIPSWSISDPLVRSAVCLHYYFDDSGHYQKTYAEHAGDIIKQGYASVADKTDYTLTMIQRWRAAHPEVPVWLGEVGWGIGPEWDADGRDLLSRLNALGIPWVYDSLAPNAVWQTATPGAMEPFRTSATTLTGTSPLDVARDQGRAIADLAGGSVFRSRHPLAWPKAGWNAVHNPRAVAGGAAIGGLAGWGNVAPTYLTGQTGWANGTTTAARVTVASANTGLGNGVKVSAPISTDVVATGETVTASAQIRRSKAGTVQLQIDWLDDRDVAIAGSDVTVGATNAAAGAIVSLSGVSKPRPAGARKARLSVLATAAGAGETVEATNLAVGLFGVGGENDWRWTGAVNASPSVAPDTATSDLTAKLDKPTGKTGQLVYNATTNTWEAAPAGGGVVSGGTELVHQAADGSWPAVRPSAVSVIAAGNPSFPSDPPGWLTDADLYLDISGQGATPATSAWVFPTANPSLLSKFEMLPNEADLSRRANTGTEVTFATLNDTGYFRGGGKVWNNDWYGQAMYRPGSNGDGIGTSAWAISVTTDSQWLVLNGNSAAISGQFEGYLQVVVDGQIVWDSPQAVAGTNGGTMAGVLVEFPSAATRTVDIYTKWTMYSIGRAAGSSLAPGNPSGKKKVALLGDSWTQGTDQAGAWKSYAHVVQQTTPGWDVSFNGLGGTGWATTGTDPWNLPFAAALRQHCVADGIPDLIVAYGSINDQDSSAATVKTRVQEFLSGVASISPTSKVLIVGPEMERPNTLAAMRSITAPNLVGVVDPSSWLTSADLGPSDMVHPNAQGVRTIAGKMIATIKEKTGW